MSTIKCRNINCNKEAQYVTPAGCFFCFGCALKELYKYFDNPRNPIYVTDSWEKYYQRID